MRGCGKYHRSAGMRQFTDADAEAANLQVGPLRKTRKATGKVDAEEACEWQTTLAAFTNATSTSEVEESIRQQFYSVKRNSCA